MKVTFVLTIKTGYGMRPFPSKETVVSIAFVSVWDFMRFCRGKITTTTMNTLKNPICFLPSEGGRYVACLGQNRGASWLDLLAPILGCWSRLYKRHSSFWAAWDISWQFVWWIRKLVKSSGVTCAFRASLGELREGMELQTNLMPMWKRCLKMFHHAPACWARKLVGRNVWNGRWLLGSMCFWR